MMGMVWNQSKQRQISLFKSSFSQNKKQKRSTIDETSGFRKDQSFRSRITPGPFSNLALFILVCFQFFFGGMGIQSLDFNQAGCKHMAQDTSVMSER